MSDASPPPSPPLDHVAELGRRFEALGLRIHADHLRHYFRARQNGEPPPTWDDAFVLDWLRVLRVPPHDAFYDLRRRNAPCPCGANSSYTQRTFPGGSVHSCFACRSTRLELDAPP